MGMVLISKSRAVFALGAIFAMGVASSEAQAAQPVAKVERVAAVSAAGPTLTFTPKVADGMMLTVSGPRAVYWSREFSPGEAPSFVLFDDRGPLPDGRYNYELRTQPQVDQQLQQIAQERDDDRLARELARDEAARVLLQAGRFTVAGGSIVLPRLEIETEGATSEHEHGADTHSHE